MLRIILILAFLLSRSLLAQPDVNLTGLNKLNVQIFFSPEFEEYLSYTLFRTDAELKLRQNGIEIVANADDSQAVFYIAVHGFLSSNERTYIANIEINVVEGAYLTFRLKEKPTYVISYSNSRSIKSGLNDWEAVRDVLKDLVDIFLNQYLANNPKK